MRHVPSLRRLLAMVAAIATGGVALASCGSGPVRYEVTAQFSRAVALYEGADVMVMGIDVGDVTGIEIAAEGIVVTMAVADDVPLPADASAAIVASSLIGERTVELGPPWRDGDDRLADGGHIPEERTVIPVEPDDALRSVTDLLHSLDPESVRRLLDESAGALEGNGSTVHAALGELAQLIPYLAEQDDELLALAADVSVIADVIRSRDTQLGALLRDFATVSDALAHEREALAGFLRSLTSLTAQGEALLTAYTTELPEDMDTLASVALTVQANAGSVETLLRSLREFQVGTIEAYDPASGSIRARVYTSQTLLNPIVEILLALGQPPPGSDPDAPLPIPDPRDLPDPGDVVDPPPVPDPGDDDVLEPCIPLVDPGCEP